MSDNHRILVVNKLYPPHIGGIETLVKDRVQVFSKRSDADLSVLVCQDKGKGICETVDGVTIRRAGSLGIFFSCPLSFSFFHHFRKMAKQAETVEIHMPFPLADLAESTNKGERK